MTRTEPTAQAARDTLGGAVAAASELPARTAGPVLDIAREAFAWSFELAAGVSAALAIAAAVVAVAFLRHVGE